MAMCGWVGVAYDEVWAEFELLEEESGSERGAVDWIWPVSSESTCVI